MTETEIEKLVVRMVGDISGFEKAIKSATSQVGTFSAAIKQQSLAATNAVKGIGPAFGGVASSSLLNSAIAASAVMRITSSLATVAMGAVTAANSFELEMSRITGLVGVSKDTVDKWSDSVLGMAGATGQGPQKLAEALYFVTSAGFKGSESLEILEMSAKAATAGMGEAKTMADALTSAMNAYQAEGLSAARATNILVAGVREGKVEVSGFAAVVGSMLPLASAMGVAFEDVVGTVAVLSRTGATAQQASTSIQALLSGLRKPSEEGKKALASVGMSFDQLRETARESGGIITILRQLDDAFGDNAEAMSDVIPNIRSIRGALNVLNQDASVVSEVMAGVKNDTDALGKAFDVAASTNAVKFQMAFAKMQANLIQIGEVISDVITPVLTELSDIVSGVTSVIMGLSPEVRSGIVVIVGLAMAVASAIATFVMASMAIGLIAPALGTLFGVIPAIGSFLLGIPAMLAGIPALLAGIPALLAGIPALIAASLPFILPIVAGVLAIGAAVAVVAVFIQDYIESVGGLEKAWEDVKAKAIAAWDWLLPIRQALISLFGTIVTVGKQVWDSFRKIVLDTWKSIVGNTKVNWDSIRDTIRDTILFAEFSILNFEKIAKTAWTGTQLGFVVMVEEIKHFFTDVIPYSLGWFLSNWQSVFMTVMSFTNVAIGSVVANIVKIIGSIDWYGLWVKMEVEFRKAMGLMLVNIINTVQNMQAIIIKKLVFDEVWKATPEVEVKPDVKVDLEKAPDMEEIKKEVAKTNKGAFTEFNLPVRVNASQTEMDLREKLGKQTDDIAESFSAFKAQKLALFAAKDVVPDAEVKESVDKSKKAGKGIGGGLTSGVKESLKELDSVLVGSKEALERYGEYRKNLDQMKQDQAIQDIKNAEKTEKQAMKDRIAELKEMDNVLASILTHREAINKAKIEGFGNQDSQKPGKPSEVRVNEDAIRDFKKELEIALQVTRINQPKEVIRETKILELETRQEVLRRQVDEEVFKAGGNERTPEVRKVREELDTVDRQLQEAKKPIESVRVELPKLPPIPKIPDMQIPEVPKAPDIQIPDEVKIPKIPEVKKEVEESKITQKEMQLPKSGWNIFTPDVLKEIQKTQIQTIPDVTKADAEVKRDTEQPKARTNPDATARDARQDDWQKSMLNVAIQQRDLLSIIAKTPVSTLPPTKLRE